MKHSTPSFTVCASKNASKLSYDNPDWVITRLVSLHHLGSVFIDIPPQYAVRNCKMHTIWGANRRGHAGELTTLPNPLVGWGEDTPVHTLDFLLALRLAMWPVLPANTGSRVISWIFKSLSHTNPAACSIRVVSRRRIAGIKRRQDCLNDPYTVCVIRSQMSFAATHVTALFACYITSILQRTRNVSYSVSRLYFTRIHAPANFRSRCFLLFHCDHFRPVPGVISWAAALLVRHNYRPT